MHLVVRRGAPWAAWLPLTVALTFVLLLLNADALDWAGESRVSGFVVIVTAYVLAAAFLVLHGRLRTHVVLDGRTLTAWEVRARLPVLGLRSLDCVRDIACDGRLGGSDTARPFDDVEIVAHSLRWPHCLHVLTTSSGDTAEYVRRRLRRALFGRR